MQQLSFGNFIATMGNNLGWSDAAMFNLVKALELALNDGVCTLTGKQMGAHTGTIERFETYEDVLRALDTQVDFFFERMIRCCEAVEKAHAELLPSPFLSAVIDDCVGEIPPRGPITVRLLPGLVPDEGDAR